MCTYTWCSNGGGLFIDKNSYTWHFFFKMYTLLSTTVQKQKFVFTTLLWPSHLTLFGFTADLITWKGTKGMRKQFFNNFMSCGFATIPHYDYTVVMLEMPTGEEWQCFQKTVKEQNVFSLLVWKTGIEKTKQPRSTAAWCLQVNICCFMINQHYLHLKLLKKSTTNSYFLAGLVNARWWKTLQSTKPISRILPLITINRFFQVFTQTYY